MNTQIQFAFPYQGILQQMIFQYPIEKMQDYCFGGVLTWEGIANLHLYNSCQNRIPFVVIYQDNIVGYFNFERDICNPTFISNAEMILFNSRRGIQSFKMILDILKASFGIKYITFATIGGSVAHKMWKRTKIIGKDYDVIYIGVLRGACINMKQEVKDKHLFQIVL